MSARLNFKAVVVPEERILCIGCPVQQIAVLHWARSIRWQPGQSKGRSYRNFCERH